MQHCTAARKYFSHPSLFETLGLKKIFIKILLAAICFGATTASSLWYILCHPNVLEIRRLNIPSGKSYAAIVEDVAKGGFLKNSTTFKLASVLLLRDRKIKRGSYLITQGLNNYQILKMLRQGLQKPIKLTISVAKNTEDLVEQICRKLDIKSGDLLSLLSSEEFTAHYGCNPKNILALFVANTYEVYWTVSARDFVHRMHLEHEIFWNKNRTARAQELKLSAIEVSILASIVQLETTKMDEARIISGVYINRLKRGIPLCSCPTIRYVIEKDKKVNRILKKDTIVDSDFNTYKKRGLPPGPLCLPDTKYIDAVLNYEKHDYLYFSSKEDCPGHVYFAKTLTDHNRNAVRYHRKLNANKIFR